MTKKPIFNERFVERRMKQYHTLIQQLERELMQELVTNGYKPGIDDNQVVNERTASENRRG